MFPHATSVGGGNLPVRPRHIEFHRGDTGSDVTFFTDRNLQDVFSDTSRLKIAWIIEPPTVYPEIYQAIRQPSLYKQFDQILTYDRRLLRLSERFRFYPFGGCWIEAHKWQVAPKTRTLSIIASEKTIMPGHRLRHEVVSEFSGSFDSVLGRGYQPIEDKADGLSSYRYYFYFSEKLLDCFALGTIPIYWGCPKIGSFFNPRGILSFRSMRGLRRVLKRISAEDYESRLDAVYDNFWLFRQYTMPEDYIYERFLRSSLDGVR